MLDWKEIGGRLAKLRRTADQTQDEVSAAVNRSRGYLGEIETGTGTGGLEVMLALAEHFQVSLDWLLGRKPTLGGPKIGDFINDADELAWLSFWRDLDDTERTGLLRALRVAERVGSSPTNQDRKRQNTRP